MGELQSSEDRRKFPRIPKEVSIEVNKLSYPLPKKAETKGLGKDVGGGGICFAVSNWYEPKTPLILKIHITGWQAHKKLFSRVIDSTALEDPLTAIGEVVWCKKLSDDSGCEVGVKFSDIYEDDYKVFMKYLETSV